jgi:PIN domain nuclease of toxin-antitoxin system
MIDTHEFIWWADAPQKLSTQTLAALLDKSNDLYLSLASLWEMQIKVQINKLAFKRGLKNTLEMHKIQNNLQILPITAEHIYELENLPFHHKDPFDRLLIAQAISENFTLVTDDPEFSAYGVGFLQSQRKFIAVFQKTRTLSPFTSHLSLIPNIIAFTFGISDK